DLSVYWRGRVPSVPAGSNSVEEHRLAVDMADLRAVLLPVVERTNVDPLHALSDHPDRHVHVVAVPKGYQSAVVPLAHQVSGHDRVIDRDHEVQRVRTPRSHQVADLLVDDAFAGR